MPSSDPHPVPLQSEVLCSHGFPEPGSERALEDLVQLAAALVQGQAALALRDEQGVWFRAGAGFSPGQWAVLEPDLARVQGPMDPGLGALVPQDLTDGRGRCIGRLWASGPSHPALALVAGQIQLVVGMKREQAEQRTRPRGPSGSSFVPGLVHELRNFIFGISGSLDAFHARFAAQEEVAKYETVMRTSLGRLNLFMDELADYGDPKPPTWTDRDLGFLLKEAIEYEKPRAAAEGLAIRLDLEGPLPPVQADEQSLVMAFIRLIDLALGQRGSGGQVTVQAMAVRSGSKPVIRGYVESSHLKLPEVDLARLFEPFYYRASGFGRLALPVARRIFENHGGSLTAALGPGGRIRMAFTIPALLDDLRG